jgi:hypothetical protein
MKDEWSELHIGRLVLVARTTPPPPRPAKVEGWVDPTADLDALGKIRKVLSQSRIARRFFEHPPSP